MLPARSIEIIGEISDGENGSGQIILGSSVYEFNQFGDASEIDAKPPQRIDVAFVRQCCQGSHLTLFEITSPKLKTSPKVFLQWQAVPRTFSRLLIGDPRQSAGVTYPDAAGPHRLIIRQGKRTDWVVPLSPVGLEAWLELQAASEELPVAERVALQRIGDAAPLNFFHDCEISSGHVERISLTERNLNGESLAQLAKLVHLRHLHVAYSDSVDPAALSSALSELSTVKALVIHDVPVTVDVAKAIAEMPNLERLSLYNMEAPVIDDKGLIQISKSSRLVHLELDVRGATDEGLFNLAKLTKLSRLNLYAPQATKEGLQRLRDTLPPNCEALINLE